MPFLPWIWVENPARYKTFRIRKHCLQLSYKTQRFFYCLLCCILLYSVLDPVLRRKDFFYCLLFCILLRNFMFLSAGCFLFFSAVNFFFNFGHQNNRSRSVPVFSLKCWIRSVSLSNEYGSETLLLCKPPPAPLFFASVLDCFLYCIFPV
jgi:hypothetical protein